MPILFFARFFWWSLRVSSLLVVLMFAVLLLITAYLHSLRPELEQWASQLLQQPVRIGAIALRWEQGQPSLHLSDVRLPSPVTDQTDPHFRDILITLDWWQTLHDKRWQTQNIVIHSQQITVARQADNQLSLIGLVLPTQHDLRPDDAQQWLTWLRQQPNVRFSVEQLNWLDPNGEHWRFQHVDLNLQRDNLQQHRIQLGLVLPSNTPYLQGGELQFAGNTRWEQARLVGVNGEVQLLNARVTTPYQQRQLQRLSGTLSAVPLPLAPALADVTLVSPSVSMQAWHFTIADLQIVTDSQTLLPNQLTANLIPLQTGGYHLQGSVQVLALNQVLPLVSDWLAQGRLQTQLNQLELQGLVQSLMWQYQPNAWSVAFNLHNLHSRPQAWQPGLENFNGQLYLDQHGGRLTITQADLRWHPEKLYNQPISINKLNGTIDWQQRGQAWQFNTKGLQARLQDQPLQIHGELWLDGARTRSNLQAKLSRLPLAWVYHYVPDVVAGNVVNWLKQALVAGELSEIEAELVGPMSQWFQGEKAGFQARGQIKQALLQYHPNWPSVRDIEAKIRVRGQHLQVEAQHAALLDHTIADYVVANIEQLGQKHPLLTVEAHIASDMQEAAQFLRLSPLHRTINPDTDLPRLSGNTQLDLQLLLPLGEEKESTVKGLLTLDHVSLEEPKLQLQLDNLQGEVQFDDHGINGQLQGVWQQQPIDLSLMAVLNDSEHPVSVQLSGIADHDFLQRQLQHFAPNWSDADKWLNRLIGQTAWQLDLNLPNRQQRDSGQAETRLQLTSDLHGMAVDLPAPFAKNAATLRPLQIILSLPQAAQAAKPLQVQYGEISAALLLGQDGEEGKNALRGQIVFGTQQAVAMPTEEGWIVRGHLAYFEPMAWRQLLAHDETKRELSPLQLEVVIDELQLPALTLHTLSLQAQHRDQHWQAQINSEQLSGQVQYQPIQGIRAKLSYLRLPMPDEQAKDKDAPPSPSPFAHLSPQQVPSLSLNCAQVQLGEYKLGQVQLRTEATEYGLSLAEFSLYSTQLNVTASGEWRQTATGQHTALTAKGSSDNVEQLLQNYGFSPAPIADGHLEWLLDVVWQDSPLAFALENTVGTLSLLLTKGHLVTVEPGTVGRVIGLFDLQALPKRLDMDFRDVFEAGLGFEIIAGDFALLDGYAETDNLILQASAARVEIKGRTNLTARTYDQKITVTPRASSTLLPLAGVLAGGLSAGAVTLIVHQLLQNQIEKAMQYHYQLTGSWLAPELKALVGSFSFPQGKSLPISERTRD